MKKSDVLKEIVLKKKERLAAAKQNLPEDAIKALMQGLSPVRPFMKAINKPNTISLIAEIKKASPSQGVIRNDFDPVGIARIYKEAGAQALSVLTEEDFFQGSPAFIQDIKAAVDLPVLRKDFIFEPYQVYESRLLGADAILLIADLLSKDSLSELLRTASGLGLECLVEAHTEKDLKKVLSLKAPLVGINNRDLHTLETDPKTIERLFILAPKDRVVVAESGIKSSSDILFLKILGVKAVLIGQAFMESPDIKRKVEDVMGW
jgi:indole-3-glycerol phosphate synthase